MRVHSIEKNISVLAHKDHLQMANDIEHKRYQDITVLKDSPRSLVKLIRYQEKNLVHKVPKEKNKKFFNRFTTLYRKGEAFRSLESLNKLKQLNILGNTPLFAVEKRKFGMIIDSYLVYEYLEGKKVLEKDIPDVICCLNKIHATKYIHGDSQKRNFLKLQDNIAVIDASPKKKIFMNFWKMYELIYLKASISGGENHFIKFKKHKTYKLARCVHLVVISWRRFKDRVKGRCAT